MFRDKKFLSGWLLFSAVAILLSAFSARERLAELPPLGWLIWFGVVASGLVAVGLLSELVHSAIRKQAAAHSDQSNSLSAAEPASHQLRSDVRQPASRLVIGLRRARILAVFASAGVGLWLAGNFAYSELPSWAPRCLTKFSGPPALTQSEMSAINSTILAANRKVSRRDELQKRITELEQQILQADDDTEKTLLRMEALVLRDQSLQLTDIPESYVTWEQNRYTHRNCGDVHPILLKSAAIAIVVPLAFAGSLMILVQLMRWLLVLDRR